MAKLKRDVHLVLSPRAARVLDEVCGSFSGNEFIHLKPEEMQIIKDIRKQIREFAKDPQK